MSDLNASIYKLLVYSFFFFLKVRVYLSFRSLVAIPCPKNLGYILNVYAPPTAAYLDQVYPTN